VLAIEVKESISPEYILEHQAGTGSKHSEADKKLQGVFEILGLRLSFSARRGHLATLSPGTFE
jgi:hypothetical protein